MSNRSRIAACMIATMLLVVTGTLLEAQEKAAREKGAEEKAAEEKAAEEKAAEEKAAEEKGPGD